jgi:septin family protein
MKKNRDLKKQEIVDFVKKNKDVLLRELLSKFGKVTSNLIYEMGGLKAIKAGTYKNSPQEKSSQSKSWETRRKDNLFKKYQNAK